MARWKEIVCGVGGSEIAEAALVLPIAFMILLGIYWFGLAFNIYGTITQAAQQGARVAVANSCASCGNAAPRPTAITTAVQSVLQASHLTQAKQPPGR